QPAADDLPHHGARPAALSRVSQGPRAGGARRRRGRGPGPGAGRRAGPPHNRIIFFPESFTMQSTPARRRGLHVAIIMDGNGRWATRRGLPRSAGHRAGIQTVRRVVEAAPDLGVAVLSLFAFSSDNWRRPEEEVG